MKKRKEKEKERVGMKEKKGKILNFLTVETQHYLQMLLIKKVVISLTCFSHTCQQQQRDLFHKVQE